MCEAFDYKVISLKRVRIMHIQLGAVASGKWRYLSDAEMQEMMRLMKDSKNEG
jgi:23S rRNA pseudouridine2604 synthase